MLDILKSRQRAAEEEEALTTQPKSLNPTLRAHRISAQALSNLLDERKSATTKDELKELCKMYGVDYEIVDELSTSVMAPSVSSIKSAKDEEEETQLVSCSLSFIVHRLSFIVAGLSVLTIDWNQGTMD